MPRRPPVKSLRQLSSGPAAGQLNSGIVAGDFSSGVASQAAPVENRNGTTARQAYWRTYAQHLNRCATCTGVRPWIWGVHPYIDIPD